MVIHTYTAFVFLYSTLSLISEHLMTFLIINQARLSTVERVRVHMVARLKNINITLSRYFRIAQVGSCVWGLCLFISGNPVVFLCGHIKHWYLLNILNRVLVFKLSAVHCCTHAKISIQGQLYRYSYHQISVMIHRHIDVSNTALLVTGSSTWHLMAKNSLRIWKRIVLLYIKMA